MSAFEQLLEEANRAGLFKFCNCGVHYQIAIHVKFASDYIAFKCPKCGCQVVATRESISDTLGTWEKIKMAPNHLIIETDGTVHISPTPAVDRPDFVELRQNILDIKFELAAGGMLHVDLYFYHPGKMSLDPSEVRHAILNFLFGPSLGEILLKGDVLPQGKKTFDYIVKVLTDRGLPIQTFQDSKEGVPQTPQEAIEHIIQAEWDRGRRIC